MEQWQPARLRTFHGIANIGEPISDEDLSILLGRVVMVREAKPSELALREYRADGCDGTRFFEIHPDSVKGTAHRGSIVFVCEHEILTD